MGVNNRARTTRRAQTLKLSRFKPSDGYTSEIEEFLPLARIETKPRSEVVYIITTNNVNAARYVEQTEQDSESDSGNDSDINLSRKSLQDTLKETDKSLMWVLEELDLPCDDGLAIAEMIKANNGRCMSDGSLKELFGTSAFTFLIKDTKN